MTIILKVCKHCGREGSFAEDICLNCQRWTEKESKSQRNSRVKLMRKQEYGKINSAILKILDANETVSKKRIHELTRYSTQQIDRVMSRLISQGKVKRMGWGEYQKKKILAEAATPKDVKLVYKKNPYGISMMKYEDSEMD